MNIKSAKYIKSSYANENACINVVLKDAPANTFMSVPLDTANRHYQAIQEWVAEGNTIAEAD